MIIKEVTLLANDLQAQIAEIDNFMKLRFTSHITAE